MEHWLYEIAEHVALTIEAAAILIIAYASAEALVATVRVMVRHGTVAERRLTWMRYAHWLAAGLTFQLAADVVSTTVTPDWTRIGRVAAVAAIRTFITYFLDRDLADARERHEAEAPS